MIQYPKGEHVWERIFNTGQIPVIIVTSKQQRDYYYLYELKDGKYVKLGRGRNPRELKEKYQVDRRAGFIT